MLKLNYKHKKAFTLIELLIVIAIIGILFIVLVSKVDFATDKAKATGVQTDFKSFQMAFDTVAKENAGFNTFGWDTGDANQDGIRNSYDEGDNGAGGGIAKNGVQDGAEVFTGRKVYDETFTKAYSLKKNGTGSYDRDALNRLETAINANLDPKLHITIKDDGEIIMANGAQDPWNKEYHGWYITNAENDKKDRGAIVMYSDGANNEFGSKHTIANGVVNVIVPDNNKAGKDDYSIVSCYTYVNGYGEVKNLTTGFSNNQSFLAGGSANSGEIDDNVVTPQQPADSIGLEFSFNDGGQSYSVVGIGTCTDTDIVIPDTYEGLPVTAIGWAAFIREQITSVVIPDSVTTISNRAFEECANLANVTFGKNVTTIVDTAFYNCTSLMNITLPDSVTNIGYEAFYNTGYYNNELNWENDVLYIGKYLIVAKNNISGVYTIKPGTKLIAYQAFGDCDNLTDIIIPDSVIYINSSAFYGCDGLTHIIIPSSVIELDGFSCCNNLESVSIIGSNLRTIGNYALDRCRKLTSITIPNSVTSIGYGAFSECESLTSIIIPNSVTSIGDWAFRDCTNLTSITMSDSITSLGRVLLHGTAFYNDKSNWENNTVLYIDKYLIAAEHLSGEYTIKPGTTVIPDLAFSPYNQDLTSITIPDSVTFISKETFMYTGIKTVVIDQYEDESLIEPSKWIRYYEDDEWAGPIPRYLNPTVIWKERT